MTTFTLSLTKGKTRSQLAADYRRMLRAASRWQRVAMFLIEAAPTAVKKLPPKERQMVERLIEAYKD